MAAAPDEGSEPTWGLGDAAVGWLVAEAAATIGGGILLAIYGLSGDAAKSENLPLTLLALSNIPLWLGFLGAPVYAARKKGHGIVRDFGFRFRWVDLPLGIALGLVSQYVLVPLISAPWLRVLGKSEQDLNQVASNLASSATDTAGIILLILIVAVAAPFVEELFFRGLVFRSLEKRFPVGIAIALSGIIFGATHFEVLQFPALAAFGALLAFVVWRTGRLGTTITAHLTFNLVTIAALLSKTLYLTGHLPFSHPLPSFHPV